MPAAKHKRTTVAVLGAIVLLLLLLLAALNAFNLNAFFYPHSAAAIFLFTALSIVVFLLFITLLLLLSRNILKIYADRRSRLLGSRLRSRMLIGALLLSFAPAVFLFLFSFGLMNRSIDRWFSQPVSQLREDSTRIAFELSHYVTQNARAEADSLARSEAIALNYQAENTNALLDEIRTHRITLQGGFTIIYKDETPIAQYQLPVTTGVVTVRTWMDNNAQLQPKEPLTAIIRQAAPRTDEPVLALGDMEYALGMATTSGGGVIVVGLPLPSGLSATIAEIRSGTEKYWAVYRERRAIRWTYLLSLLLLTALTFFASSWLAWFFSKQITRPLENLADAMDEIAAGHYGQRVTVSATEELGELLQAFNHMAADLEQSRMIAEQSTAQVSEANIALEQRRRELETILETIPGGVVTLDGGLHIIQANQAFADLLPPGSPESLHGVDLTALLPSEVADGLKLLARRAQRMGVAASEFEVRSTKGKLNLAATMALLHLGQNRRGSILVLEDVTEFLHAQRQLAWKEVAQRVAHEIKNPLTPIALSAERIKRHLDRNTPESPDVIRSCSNIILGSVETMRTLVDQFAVLAQFPTAQPAPADLNSVVESALLLFEDRLDDIRVEVSLDPVLPPVMADAEALKRALTNLIDNAAEAMRDSRTRILKITTGLTEHHEMAEVVLSDTGHGLTDETRERLFLPYFSTKQRGTGLGLAIAAKIIQDHQGAIRAEQNYPVGARFIIELPLAGYANGNHEGVSITIDKAMQ